MGEFGSSDGCSEERTNSGESILERWERKSGRQGATPIPAGVLDELDIVRAMCRRRLLDLEAILKRACQWT